MNKVFAYIYRRTPYSLKMYCMLRDALKRNNVCIFSLTKQLIIGIGVKTRVETDTELHNENHCTESN